MATRLKATRMSTMMRVLVIEATMKLVAPKISVASSLKSILGSSEIIPGV